MSPRRPSLVASYSEAAESALIGTAMLSDTAMEVLASQVVPEDFYVPRLQTIARHMIRLYHAGVRPDPVSLGDELTRFGELALIGGPSELIHIQALAPATSNAPNYARLVIEYAARRRVAETVEKIREQVSNGAVGLDAIMDEARRTFGTLDLPVLSGKPDPDILAFLDGPTDYEWLADGLLEKRDRLIITGGEGGGKSTLLRQVAVCLSAGIQPFTGAQSECGPIKVTLIDCENSDRQIRRKMAWLYKKAMHSVPGYDPECLRISVKTEGLDLMQRVDVRWLMERCEANQPDLLIVGPLYKLHAGDPSEEGPARMVSRTFDLLRARYGCAVMIEAHSPYTQNDGKRVGRPYGASLWSRWPEFGYVIRPNEDDLQESFFESWRGARDEREWPATLRRGNMDNLQEWPWMQNGSMTAQDF